GDLFVQSAASTTIGNGARLTTSNGDITVVTGNFVNNSGIANDLTAGGAGNVWQVWSSNANQFRGATPDVRGTLNYDFKQYNATYGITTPLGTGNGLFYTYAPTVNATLGGSATKVYDATTSASNAALTLIYGGGL